MHNLASVLENKTHKLLWDFDIQMDHLISVWRPNIIIINKKKKELAEMWILLFWPTIDKIEIYPDEVGKAWLLEWKDSTRRD